ncbi:hypothetical protein L210DRAFT_955230 [Boletus edulis BED1]|uniref:Uncharacterized protein n=1 Tax=Boletus edulis BED1 TaxID=1328754 RepID=A0AAD4BI65_BOLED|nr:hypothetical protein L210DRAFT_955230 [Boletus edulis BED1]
MPIRMLNIRALADTWTELPSTMAPVMTVSACEVTLQPSSILSLFHAVLMQTRGTLGQGTGRCNIKYILGQCARRCSDSEKPWAL